MHYHRQGFFTIAAALTLGLAITPTASAQYKGCSNAGLRGSFSQTGSGVITSQPDQAGPFASDCTGTYTVQINPFGFSSQAFFAIDSRRVRRALWAFWDFTSAS
jgi:hypothetical protein